MTSKPEVQFVAVTLVDDSLHVMNFSTVLDRRRLSPMAALDHNFVQESDDAPWTRDASAENVAAEIAATAWPAEVRSWRLISAKDIPADRTDRDAWQDNGKAIEVDVARKAMLAENAITKEKA